MDRARGTLAHMLMTDLSDAEIVLGKLAARLLPVLGLVACTWPVMAISSLLGGIDPIALTLAFAIIVAMAVSYLAMVAIPNVSGPQRGCPRCRFLVAITGGQVTRHHWPS